MGHKKRGTSKKLNPDCLSWPGDRGKGGHKIKMRLSEKQEGICGDKQKLSQLGERRKKETWDISKEEQKKRRARKDSKRKEYG
jgi:hypothetical protein